MSQTETKQTPTPGPWTAEYIADDCPLLVNGPEDANIDPVADVRHSIAEFFGPDRVANATLAAAASELLAACKAAYPLVGENGGHGFLVAKQLRDAITKAEGR